MVVFYVARRWSHRVPACWPIVVINYGSYRHRAPQFPSEVRYMRNTEFRTSIFFCNQFYWFCCFMRHISIFFQVFTVHPKRGGELMRAKEHNLLFIELMVSYFQVFHSKNLCNRIKCWRKVIIGFSQRERLWAGVKLRDHWRKRIVTNVFDVVDVVSGKLGDGFACAMHTPSYDVRIGSQIEWQSRFDTVVRRRRRPHSRNLTNISRSLNNNFKWKCPKGMRNLKFKHIFVDIRFASGGAVGIWKYVNINLRNLLSFSVSERREIDDAWQWLLKWEWKPIKNTRSSNSMGKSANCRRIWQRDERCCILKTHTHLQLTHGFYR